MLQFKSSLASLALFAATCYGTATASAVTVNTAVNGDDVVVVVAPDDQVQEGWLGDAIDVVVDLIDLIASDSGGGGGSGGSGGDSSGGNTNGGGSNNGCTVNVNNTGGGTVIINQACTPT